MESLGCRESRHCWALDPTLYLGPQHTQGLENAVTFWSLISAPPCHTSSNPVLKGHSLHERLAYAPAQLPVLAVTPAGVESSFPTVWGTRSQPSLPCPPPHLLMRPLPPIPLGGSSELGQHLHLLLQHHSSCWICSSKQSQLTQLRKGPATGQTSTFPPSLTNLINLESHLVHPGSLKQPEKGTSRVRWQKRCCSPALCLYQGHAQA